MKKLSGSTLTLLGAASFYALGRWGGARPAEVPDLIAPLLATSGGAPLAAIVIAGTLLGTGMVLLTASEPPLAGEVRPLRPLQVIAGLNAIIILGCLLTVTVGASEGWDPRTVAAWTVIGMAEVGIGLLLVPFHLASGGPRSISILSATAVLLGTLWTGSVVGLGMI